NAQLLAEMAQGVTGGDLFFIETVEKYPAAYRGTTDQAKEEQNDDVRPELVSHVEDMESYDTIILIYPNWWGTLPQAVFTFLEEYDFSGKTIWPLCTHEGSRLGKSESDIAELVPDAQLVKGLAIKGDSVGSAQTDVEAWLSDLKISD
ncbi:MAG: flavodoxin, partial [Lachnospiraceae bacterium]|nr:flavodoxin [Lachnospiraceae bacterium]